MKRLEGKVAVITGGGGILCSTMAIELASNGAKIAILDLNKKAADEVANEIVESGGIAIGIECNVLQKESIKEARKVINEKLGACDILLNGAGGNHPKGTTTKEYFDVDDIGDLDEKDLRNITFFDLDLNGIDFVFKLNFIGTFLTTQIFAKDMVEKEDTCIINISSMSALSPLTKIPAYSAAKASVSNFTQWAFSSFCRCGDKSKCNFSRFFCNKAK